MPYFHYLLQMESGITKYVTFNPFVFEIVRLVLIQPIRLFLVYSEKSILQLRYNLWIR